ncbi:MAG: phosphatidylcholine synthase [Alphaproteobacteria bacterium]|nr:MAG: phosphatidylcholine synthase [Alphaproteobacteria bacterium]
MSLRVAAAVAIHLLTASGALLGLLALGYGAAREWSAVFLCLGAALVIDGLDGPLARRCGVEEVLPRFSGVRLDLTVDYLNYCVVPAFLVLHGPLISGAMGYFSAAVLLLTSLFHFADRRAKTEDGYFVGFPAVWNIVVFYFFALGMSGSAVAMAIMAIGVFTFIPFKWTHPLRVVSYRHVTLAVTAIWSGAALYTVVTGFPAPFAAQLILLAAAFYFVGLCALASRG